MTPGKIVWHDLTVPQTEAVRDFYAAVVGWTWSPQGDDFNMNLSGSEDAVAGVCHPVGANAALPPVWLVYISVEDVKASVAKCLELGGKVLLEPRDAGGMLYAVVQDPAGAPFALFG